MQRRKISRLQVERVLREPELTYRSYDKLVAEGATASGNTVVVYYVEPEGTEGEALVISVKRVRGAPGRRGSRR